MDDLLKPFMDTLTKKLPDYIIDMINDDYFEDEVNELGAGLLKKAAEAMENDESAMDKLKERVLETITERALEEDDLDERVISKVLEKVAEQVSTSRVDEIARAVRLKLPSADQMAEEVISRIKDEEIAAVRERLAQKGID